jgi:hypothetical protein
MSRYTCVITGHFFLSSVILLSYKGSAKCGVKRILLLQINASPGAKLAKDKGIKGGAGWFMEWIVIGLTYPESYRHIRRSSGITRIGVRTARLSGSGQSYIVKYANKSKKTAVDDLDND